MTTQERFARRRKKLEEKLTRLDLQEARTLQREQAHDEQIARDLAGVPGHFAHGLNFYKLFWVFFSFAVSWEWSSRLFFAGFASGRLSQRTGLVWGPFNLILRHRRGAAHRLPASVHRKKRPLDLHRRFHHRRRLRVFLQLAAGNRAGHRELGLYRVSFQPERTHQSAVLPVLGRTGAGMGERGISTAERLYRTARFPKPTVSSSVGCSSHLCLRTLL